MQPFPNPYAPPASPDAPHASEPFPAQSVWLMLLLIIVTLGVYVPHWFYTRGKAVNHQAGGPLVSIGAITALYALHGASVGLIAIGFGLLLLSPESIPDGGSFWQLSDGLDKIVNIATLVAAFHFRSALHKLLGSYESSATWLSAVATFFFGALYFQYKINRGLLLFQAQPPLPPYGYPPQPSQPPPYGYPPQPPQPPPYGGPT